METAENRGTAAVASYGKRPSRTKLPRAGLEEGNRGDALLEFRGFPAVLGEAQQLGAVESAHLDGRIPAGRR